MHTADGVHRAGGTGLLRRMGVKLSASSVMRAADVAALQRLREMGVGGGDEEGEEESEEEDDE